jgi:hypothetical protein
VETFVAFGNRREAEFVPGVALGLSFYPPDEVVFVPARGDLSDRSSALEASADNFTMPFIVCATNCFASRLSGIFYGVIDNQ